MCPDCLAAAQKLHNTFNDLPCCRARAAARSQHFSKAFKDKRQHREYRQLIEFIGVTNEQVVEAAKQDRSCDRLMGKVAA